MESIKIEELRVGNYVYDDFNEIHKVEKIESQRFNDWNGSDPSLVIFSKLKDTYNGMYTCDVVSAIPLTPGILLKAGFERIGEFLLYRKVCRTFDFDLFSWETPVGQANGVPAPAFYIVINKHIIIVEFVHQLQNLYHPLTSTELKIEL